MKYTIPHSKNIKNKWIIKQFNKCLKEYDRVPTEGEFVRRVKKKYRTNSFKILRVSITANLAERHAMAFASTQSIDACLDYRYPDKLPDCPPESYSSCRADDGWECAICLDTVQNKQVRLHSCGCTFHELCLLKSYNHYQKCPTCRTEM